MTMMVSVTLGSLPNSLMCIICTTTLQAGSSYEKGEGRRDECGMGRWFSEQKCSSYKGKDLCLVSGIYSKSQVWWWHTLVIPALGRQAQENPWSLPPSQPP